MNLSTSTATPTRKRFSGLRPRLVTLGLSVLAGCAIIGATAGPALAEELGGINVQAACERQYGAQYTAVVLWEYEGQKGFTTWKCQWHTDRGGVDMDQACRDQYNVPNARATYRDENSPYTWYCYR